MKWLRERETHLSPPKRFSKNYIMTKVGYDEVGIKTTEEDYIQFVTGRCEIFSQESKKHCRFCKWYQEQQLSKSCKREILEKTRQCVSDEIARCERYRQELKPFHVIAKPLKTNAHIANWKSLAEYVV